MGKDFNSLMETDMRVVSLKDVDMVRVDWLMKMATFMMVILCKVFQRVKAYN